MIRPDFIKRKISLIQDDLVKLSGFSQYSLSQITSDYVKQAAIERFLERIISRAIDINQHIIVESDDAKISPPKDYKETFTALFQLGIYPDKFAAQISKSIGTRNILIHEYDKIDYSLIYDSIADCLKDYHRYCEFILSFLEKTK